jgi:hypothetical protein
MVAKAISSIADAMKAQPLAVALVLVNLAFLGAGGYVLEQVASADRALINQLVEGCFKLPSKE